MPRAGYEPNNLELAMSYSTPSYHLSKRWNVTFQHPFPSGMSSILQNIRVRCHSIPFGYTTDRSLYS